MICTLFTGHPVRRVFFMRYTYEFKKKCVELYRQGQWAECPEGISEKRFKDTVREWVRIEEAQGCEALKHKNQNKVWSPDEKLELVLKVISGQSNKSVALNAGINQGMLYQWVYKYKILGYNGLVNTKKGRPSKNPKMKKKTTIEPKPLTESEREELIRLRAENEYIKTENEVIKKLIALREEKQAALLKAKKQRSSKNSAKKDTN